MTIISKKVEAYFQQKIEELYPDGARDTGYFGITDLSLENCHMELKQWNQYKDALGQLLFYNRHTPKSKLIVIFFGICPYTNDKQREIVNGFSEFNIQVKYFTENEILKSWEYTSEPKVKKSTRKTVYMKPNERKIIKTPKNIPKIEYNVEPDFLNFVKSNFTPEEFKLLEDVLNTHIQKTNGDDRFPIEFDKLSSKLGYNECRYARRVLHGNFVEDEDFQTLRTKTINGMLKTPYVTPSCAKRFVINCGKGLDRNMKNLTIKLFETYENFYKEFTNPSNLSDSVNIRLVDKCKELEDLVNQKEIEIQSLYEDLVKRSEKILKLSKENFLFKLELEQLAFPQ